MTALPVLDRRLDVVDDEFRAATLEPQSPPTRFLVNLSERCQLRCAHCITNAPALTSTNAARDLDERVLHAIAPHLEHAAYVGLVHAGEPMLAPLFEAFLEELRRRRRDQPTVVHLLTNGMALTESKLERVLDRGVKSLSFSLDGLSSTTNDVLRIGAKADLLVDRIRRTAAIAHERGVRVGLSWVVTKANLAEIPALVQLASSSKLDWLKLEELFVRDESVKHLVVDRYALDVAVANARSLADELGVPLLDHTRAMTVWRCQLHVDARMRKRALVDDLVNRVELNPCRAPWETVCIEPNGDAKPLSFHHPVGGNVVEKSLLEIWKSAPAFVDARKTVRATRLCGAGPTTCAKDAGPAAW